MKVFLDKTDIGVGKSVTDALCDELRESKYLVVICSPNIAYPDTPEKTNWVEKEIKNFLAMGHSVNDIFPIVIDGKIKSGTENDCYTQKLHELNINAADVTTDGKKNAFIRLLAALLGIKYDDIKQRERNRRVKKIAVIALLAGAILAGAVAFIPKTIAIAFALRIAMYIISGGIAVGVGAFVIWNTKYKTAYEYYADYVDKWGMPTGIYPLTKEQISHRENHFRFEYRAGRLQRVVCANSAGMPVEQIDSEFKNRLMIQEMHYDAEGKLQGIYSKDRNGRILVEKEFGKNYGRVNLKGEKTDSQTLGASVASMGIGMFENQENKSSITSFSYKRDSDGYIIQELFRKYHNADVPAKDADGIFGFDYVLNGNGQIKEIWYLDENSNRLSTKCGVAGKRYEYEETVLGTPTKVTYLDKNGNPIQNEKLWTISIDKLDDYGNVIERAYFNAEGKPILKIDGFSIGRWKYDERGNLSEVSYYDEKGKPTYRNNDYAIAKWKYDEQGNVIEASFFGENGKCILCKNGFAIIKWEYDEQGNAIEKSYYDANDKSAFCKDGYSVIRWKYDERGNTIETSYYDANGKSTFCKDRYSVIRWKYDEKGNTIEVSYYNTQGNSVLCKDGYAIKQWKYDERGNTIETSYYDTNGSFVRSENLILGTSKNLLKRVQDLMI